MKHKLLICALLFVAGCSSQTISQSAAESSPKQGCDAFVECADDAADAGSASFKEAYESLNGKENANGKIHRTITIADDHPFLYASEQEVIERLDDGESFYLYIGDEKCPWCRAVIETAIAKAAEHGVDEILYLPIWDDEGNEILRDKYELVDGKPVQVSGGTAGYQELLKRFDSVLDSYTLTADDEKEVEVGEKRIYAPSFFRIIGGGREVYMTTGIPEDLTDPRAELSEDQEKEIANQLDELFKAGSLVNVK